jgi:hypothetical protein
MRRLKSDRDWKAVFAAALLAAGGAGALESAHPPLIRAAAARRYADVRKLIEKGADPVREIIERAASASPECTR